MSEIKHFALTNIGNLDKEFNDDYVASDFVETRGGLQLYVGIVCDGTSQAEIGKVGAKEATDSILRYIRDYTEDDIPQMLIGAITTANREIFKAQAQKPQRAHTTAAVAVIDTREKPYGRLYIASVGDSPIAIIRQGEERGATPKFVRLNTDHNRKTDAIFDGMPPEEAQFLDKASALTRAIGVKENIEVDIGFYTEDKPNRKIAREKGELGLQLKKGDTIIVTSDGIFDISPQDNKPLVHEEEFLRHSRDDNAEIFARTLMGYALQRRPFDNLSLVALLVEGDRRQAILTGRLSRGQKLAGASVILALIFAAGVLAFLLTRTQAEGQQFMQEVTRTLEIETQVAAMTQTEVVVQNVFGTQSAIETQTAMPTATLTPTLTLTSTATATPSPTATPTATVRPSIQGAAGAGRSFSMIDPETDAFQSEDFPVEYRASINLENDLSYISINPRNELFDPADLYLTAGQVTINAITNERQGLQLQLGEGAALFSRNGQFTVDGVEIELAADSNIRLIGQGPCMSAAYFEPNFVQFSCYSDVDGDCRFRLPNAEEQSLAAYSGVRINVLEGTVIETLDEVYEAAEDFYTEIDQFMPAENLVCLQSYVDPDGDGVLHSADLCPNVAARTANGCPPDRDRDGVPDSRDACPDEGDLGAGIDARGCPIQPDRDRDGIPDYLDACPDRAGPPPTGCPVVIQPTARPPVNPNPNPPPPEEAAPSPLPPTLPPDNNLPPSDPGDPDPGDPDPGDPDPGDPDPGDPDPGDPDPGDPPPGGGDEEEENP